MESHAGLTNPTISRIGFWSALFSAVFALLYVIGEMINMMGWLGPLDTPASFIHRMTPSLPLAMAFIILMVSIHYHASNEKKIWSHLGLAFSIVYAGLVSIAYFAVVTVLIPCTLRGEAEQIAVLAFGHGTFLFAIDVLGDGFMSLATLHPQYLYRWCIHLCGL